MDSFLYVFSENSGFTVFQNFLLSFKILYLYYQSNFFWLYVKELHKDFVALVTQRFRCLSYTKISLPIQLLRFFCFNLKKLIQNEGEFLSLGFQWNYWLECICIFAGACLLSTDKNSLRNSANSALFRSIFANSLSRF